MDAVIKQVQSNVQTRVAYSSTLRQEETWLHTAAHTSVSPLTKITSFKRYCQPDKQ